MATAGTATVDTTGTKIFDENDPKCTSFLVHCQSGSANGCLVNILGLHSPGEFFPIPAGNEYIFRLGDYGIAEVFAKGDGGNADINYGVVANNVKA